MTVFARCRGDGGFRHIHAIFISYYDIIFEMAQQDDSLKNQRVGARRRSAWHVTRELAWFRYSLRKFLRFSEKAARAYGVTPQQHQLLLGVAGHTSHGSATISELAEFLQERHHGVGELVNRTMKRGLVRKTPDANDRRFVLVSLTGKGHALLGKLSELHKSQLEQLRSGLLGMTALEHKNRAPQSLRRGKSRGSRSNRKKHRA
jgi:DNA-binding MarR family transcriptional regulator